MLYFRNDFSIKNLSFVISITNEASLEYFSCTEEESNQETVDIPSQEVNIDVEMKNNTGHVGREEMQPNNNTLDVKSHQNQNIENTSRSLSLQNPVTTLNKGNQI